MPEQLNPDGSWSPAVPLGWQGGYDWEVVLAADRGPHHAYLYDEDVLIGRVDARTRWGLARKMRREQKRLGVSSATTF